MTSIHPGARRIYMWGLQEEFYIDQSVEKGIEIDSWRANSLASSMVDDIFFVLQKCAQRGLATRNLQCVGAIMGQVNTALATSLRAALDSRWKVGSALLQFRRYLEWFRGCAGHNGVYGLSTV